MGPKRQIRSHKVSSSSRRPVVSFIRENVERSSTTVTGPPQTFTQLVSGSAEARERKTSTGVPAPVDAGPVGQLRPFCGRHGCPYCSETNPARNGTRVRGEMSAIERLLGPYEPVSPPPQGLPSMPSRALALAQMSFDFELLGGRIIKLRSEISDPSEIRESTVLLAMMKHNAGLPQTNVASIPTTTVITPPRDTPLVRLNEMVKQIPTTVTLANSAALRKIAESDRDRKIRRQKELETSRFWTTTEGLKLTEELEMPKLEPEYESPPAGYKPKRLKKMPRLGRQTKQLKPVVFFP